MRFATQQKVLLGIGSGAGAACLAAYHWLGIDEILKHEAAWTALLGLAIFSIFVVISRSAHRWVWFYMLRSTTLWGGRVQENCLTGFGSFFWRPWMWIDSEGNDRDART